MSVGIVTTNVHETMTLRAVAAAAALEDPVAALNLARQAQADPASVVMPDIDPARLGVVLAVVTRRFTDNTGAPAPSALHNVVAQAIGAEPKLVAAAAAVLTDRTNGTQADALEWAAALEPQLLERAALAGARRRQLDRLAQPPASQVSRLDQLEGRLSALEGRLTPPPGTGGSTSSGTGSSAGSPTPVTPVAPAGQAAPTQPADGPSARDPANKGKAIIPA